MNFKKMSIITTKQSKKMPTCNKNVQPNRKKKKITLNITTPKTPNEPHNPHKTSSSLHFSPHNPHKSLLPLHFFYFFGNHANVLQFFFFLGAFLLLGERKERKGKGKEN